MVIMKWNVSYMLNQFNYKPIWFIILPVLLGICVWFLIKSVLRENVLCSLCKTMFSVYLVILLLLTVVLRDKSETTTVCMTPLFLFTLAEKENTVYRSMLLNVLMFIPFGVLLPDTLKKKNFRYLITVFIALFISMGVETLQYVFQVGRTEIDDVIFNTIGALIGCGIFRLAEKYCKKRQTE